MAINSNTVESSREELFNDIFANEGGEAFTVGFSAESVEALIEVLADLDDPPRVRLMTEESVLKALRSEFELASMAAELVAAEALSLRTTDEPFENALVITEKTMISVIPSERTVAGLVSDDGEFVDAVAERWRNVWEAGTEFGLRTPAWSQVADSLTTEFGADMEADFEAMIRAVATPRGTESALDEVEVSVLAAAKHEKMLYDVSTWGEDVGVASRATFSRVKNRLEDQGLIETEKEPIEVGRPRLRLLLGDERLREANAEELASVAGSLLSTTGA
ncbi:transcriptional regulator TbsP [Halococcus salifodinae]|uniref:Uncharacterized protein n=1 Tax=Halococcus salifodinae DSM 8989 TaxID=1227456 RepID=M0ND11_9EURY|nr:DUF5821 family protein [Halococcus salifodinae]EMA55746.1 hypothetical protein C450_00832 [Halococcus salifodinae DSM 8989]